ncbi:MAG: flagellar biosynthesis anti-sigma factor FlgM [Bacillota bacterium]
MKIDRQRIKGVTGTPRVESPRPPAPAERPAGSSQVPATDHVVLSSRTLQVSELQPALGALPAVRAELIEQLKERIARGEYSVGSQALAERLLRARVIDE